MLKNKKVCIFHTGGTIGTVHISGGYSAKKGYLKEALGKIPDLNSPDAPKWELYEMETLLDSSSVDFHQWNIIGKFIYEHFDNFDGFVVLHGTDTMAYTASALSFMLKGLSKPVIITGAQIPLSELRSDGADNLINSIIIAAQGIANEVCLYFGGRLLRANRSQKVSTEKLIAFDSPNFPYLATAGISVIYDKRLFLKKEEQLLFSKFSNVPIGVIKLFPGISYSLFEEIILDKLSAVVIETFATGGIPNEKNSLIALIERALSNGKIVVVCSQCTQGAINFGLNQTSTALKNAGAVCGFDLTTEAAVAKLYYLFSKGYKTEKIKKLMESNLCGEMTI